MQFPADAVGVVVDTYHVWWDAALLPDIARAGERIVSYQVCDWILPLPADTLLGRGHVGDGYIDFPPVTAAVAAAGYTGYIEVEIFNEAIWAAPPTRRPPRSSPGSPGVLSSAAPPSAPRRLSPRRTPGPRRSAPGTRRSPAAPPWLLLHPVAAAVPVTRPRNCTVDGPLPCYPSVAGGALCVRCAGRDATPGARRGMIVKDFDFQW